MDSDDEPSTREPEWKLADRIRGHLPLILLLIAAAIVYALVARYQWLDGDEGVYLDIGVLIVHGSQPFIDYPGREPALLYYLAAGVWAFGPNILVARGQMILLDLIAAVGIYFLARDLHSEGAGLIAAGTFLFNPFDVYYMSVVVLEAAAIVPLTWIAYLILRTKPLEDYRVLVVVGVLLAIAELTRRDSLLLAPFILTVIVVRTRGHHPGPLASVLVTTASLVSVVGAVLLTFAHYTSLLWVWNMYGPGGEAVYATPLAPSLHLGIVSYAIILEPALVILAPIALGGVLLSHRLRFAGSAVLAAVGGGILLAIWGTTMYFSWGQGELFFVGLVDLVLLAIILWRWASFELETTSLPGPKLDPLATFFLVSSILVIIGFYGLYYPSFYAHYLIEVSWSASLLVGIWLADRLGRLGAIWKGRHSQPMAPVAPKLRLRRADWGPNAPRGAMVLAIGLVVLIGISGTYSATMVLGPSNPYNQPLTSGLKNENLNQRLYSVTEIAEVASYVDAHSPPNATIFSADSVFVAQSDRGMLYNLSIIIDFYASHPFPNNYTPYTYDPHQLAPSYDQIFQRWNSTWIPLVVVGYRTRAMEENHPYFAQYLSEHYYPAVYFGDQQALYAVQVWLLGPAPATATLAAHPSSGPNPSTVVVNPNNGTVVVSSWNSTRLRMTAPNGREWNLSLGSPFQGGVRSVAFSPSGTELWVAPFGSNVTVYSFTNDSAMLRLAIVPVGSSPFAFAFDERDDTVIVASAGSDELTLVNASTFTLVGSIPTWRPPTALTYDPITGSAIFTAAGTHLASVVALPSGTFVKNLTLGGPAEELGVMGGSLFAVLSAPAEVERVGIASGAFEGSSATGPRSAGLAISPQELVVGSAGDGTVSIFNTTDLDPMGYYSGGRCVTTVALDRFTGTILAGGPCMNAILGWRLGGLSHVTVVRPAGSLLEINSTVLSDPDALVLYPGVYTLGIELDPSATTSLAVTLEMTINSSVTLDPLLSPPVSFVKRLQWLFDAEIILATALAAVAVLVAISRFPERFTPSGERNHPAPEPAAVRAEVRDWNESTPAEEPIRDPRTRGD